MTVTPTILPARPASRDDFKVAIICALTSEANAVEALFDHRWDSPNDDGPRFGKARGDLNSYSLGVLSGHNAVLAWMPDTGATSAAKVASFLNMSFVNIEIGAVVGVCGAVPGHDDYGRERVLGDVAISTSVVHYDYNGRLTDDGFKRKTHVEDVLPRLPLDLRSVLGGLQGYNNLMALEEDMGTHLAMLEKRAYLRARYPGKENDVLFAPDYMHEKEKTQCSEIGCDGPRVERERLQAGQNDPTPAVHFGSVGCGGSVLRSARLRDEEAELNELIAFEMEGAGAWENFPCLVIKGFCDYADSHKNKKWQPYAAATAAACTKAFLKVWSLSRTRADQYNSAALDKEYIQRCVKFLLRTHETTSEAIRSVPTSWLVDHDVFKNWHQPCEKSPAPLWLHVQGKPFSGKSVLMKSTISLFTSHQEKRCITLHHFFHGGVKDPTIGLSQTLLGQLLQQVPAALPDVRSWAQELKENRDPGFHSQTLLQDAICRLISENAAALIKAQTCVRIFIDGIDECSKCAKNYIDGKQVVLQYVLDLFKRIAATGVDVRVCLSGRASPVFSDAPETLTISLEQYAAAEVEKFFYLHLKRWIKQRRKPGNTEFKVRRRLRGRWSDDFNWAVSVTSMLEGAASIEDVLRIASEIPQTHMEIYQQAVHPWRTSPDKNKRRIQLLQLGLGAWRALTIDELHQAFAYIDDHWYPETIDEWVRSDMGVEAGPGFEQFLWSESGGFLAVGLHETPPIGFPRNHYAVEHLEGQRRVTFSHISAISFLHSDEGLGGLYSSEAGDSSASLEQDCHRLLFRVCVRILNRCEMDEAEDASKGLALRDYACEFWLRHLQLCEVLPRDCAYPDFVYHSCKRGKAQRLMQKQIAVFLDTGAIEGLLLQSHRERPRMMVLLATMGCLPLLQVHLEKCTACKGCINPSLEHGATVEEEDIVTYDTALANAITGGWTDTVLHLLECYRGDINAYFRGETLLYHTSYFACQTFDSEEALKRMACVESLLARGANPATASRSCYEYPLFVAIVMGNKDLLKILLRNASPERLLDLFRAASSDEGCTALHLAIVNPCRVRAQLVPILEALLDSAPKNAGLLDIPDKEGKTPRQLASEATEYRVAIQDRLDTFEAEEEEAREEEKKKKKTEVEEVSWIAMVVADWWPAWSVA